MTSINAAVAAASITVIKSNKDEIKAQGEQVAKRNARVREGTEAANELNGQVREVSADAQAATTEAENTKFFGKLTGARGRHYKEAAELNERAVELGGQAEEIDMSNDQLRDQNEDEMESMKTRLASVQRAITYVGKMTRDQPELKV